MATEASSSRTPSRPVFSCIRCANRKVKCDRQRPCGACVKHNVDCVFNPLQAPKLKRKRVKGQILVDRLRHYEALLQEQGFDPGKLPNAPDSESEPSQCLNKTQLVHGQGRFKFVENTWWKRVIEEFHDPQDASDDSFNDASDPEASDDEFGFVLPSQPKSKSRPSHPPPEIILQLWQVFVENVDPLTKAVHVPTLRPAIQKAASNIETIPRGFEALMFAIYSTAVMSLKDDECKHRFHEPRKILLSRYVSATKAALSRAKFMGSTSLVVLQALVLHLLSVRDMYEPRAVWSLTGVAVRIAQSMGLERDGVSLGLPPFESEMRRRIWWLLKTHDFQTAELCGLAKFRDLVTGADNTKWPTNVNDDQLYPGMSLPPAESHTLTDMVFVALRYELTNFTACNIAKFRRQGENSSQSVLGAFSNDDSGMYNAIKDFEEILETKYLRYCDPSQPLHLTTMLVGRLALNFIRFVTHHPRKWASTEQTPLSERQLVWEISIKLLEQHNMAQSNPQLKQFAWHAAYYQQWHALIHVLDSLRADPLIAKADKAWQIIGNIYENTPDMVFDNRKPIHVAVGKLCLKAYGDREAALKCENMYTPSTPDFILQLREKYEVAKAKRQAGDAKSRQPGGLISHSHEEDGELGPKSDANFIRPTDNLEFTDAQQSITTDPPNLNQKGAATDYDPFWLINGFDDSHIGGLDDVMNMDPDITPAQHHGLEDNATQTITWDQWDAWLADSNVIRPLSSTWDSRTGT